MEHLELGQADAMGRLYDVPSAPAGMFSLSREPHSFKLEQRPMFGA